MRNRLPDTGVGVRHNCKYPAVPIPENVAEQTLKWCFALAVVHYAALVPN